jgi:glycosyltransferase involved in cell wall biosynthesis
MLDEIQIEIEKSRAKLLNAIEGSSDITFIRIYGNIGDQLIYAGARRLLSGLEYKEISILNLENAGGELAVIAGSGCWCRPYHDMPKHLPVIEEKFQRVIVLPSSFDVSAPGVKEALSKTKALVFARERVSYEQIRDLCKADLAHDCAFFFDYTPYMRPGRGTLHAYRTDAEALPGKIPADNNDISVTCESLDEWLWTISRHEIVKTDRAHVMIAAAMLGKQVIYRASSYHKTLAIAEFALKHFPVTREETLTLKRLRERLREEALQSLSLLPQDFFTKRDEVEITIVMLSYHRLDQTINAIEALKENCATPFKLLLIDNNSGSEVQEKLKELCAPCEFIELVLLDKNLGCAGGREYAMRRVRTKYVMLIDNDIEVFPGSVEHLLHCLESNPKALAATGRVIFPDGSIHLCGGGYRIEDGMMNFELYGFGQEFDSWIGDSGPCQWVPGCLTLLRREALIDHPYDLGMRNYYEDLEWCYRLNQLNNGANNGAGNGTSKGAGDGTFYRVVESVALHFHETKNLDNSLTVEERRQVAMKYIETIAYFYKIHGLVIPNLFHYVPELGTPNSHLARLSARIFLTMVNSQGTEWMLEKWNSGELAPLFSARLIEDLQNRPARAEQDLLKIYQARYWKVLNRCWRLIRFILSFLGRGKALPAPFLFALGLNLKSLLGWIIVNG